MIQMIGISNQNDGGMGSNDGHMGADPKTISMSEILLLDWKFLSPDSISRNFMYKVKPNK